MLTERHRHIGMDALFEPSAATLATPTRSPATWPEPSSPAALTAEALQILSGTICPVVPCRQRSSIVVPRPRRLSPAGEKSTLRQHRLESPTRRPLSAASVVGIARAPIPLCFRSFHRARRDLVTQSCGQPPAGTGRRGRRRATACPRPGAPREHQTAPRGSPNERWSPSISHSAPGDCHDQIATRAHDPCSRSLADPTPTNGNTGGRPRTAPSPGPRSRPERLARPSRWSTPARSRPWVPIRSHRSWGPPHVGGAGAPRARARRRRGRRARPRRPHRVQGRAR